MVLPDLFLDQDSPEEMYKKAGLDSLSIVNKIENILKSNVVLAKNKNKNLN
jgi:1-deoxy-D-xylulose-5-phosphate synthase